MDSLTALHAAGFNGAALFGARKARPHPSHPSPSDTLQWGRAVWSAESCSVSRCGSAPRTLQWGRAVWSAERRTPMHGGISPSNLQWGRAVWSAESHLRVARYCTSTYGRACAGRVFRAGEGGVAEPDFVRNHLIVKELAWWPGFDDDSTARGRESAVVEPDDREDIRRR